MHPPEPQLSARTGAADGGARLIGSLAQAACKLRSIFDLARLSPISAGTEFGFRGRRNGIWYSRTMGGIVQIFAEKLLRQSADGSFREVRSFLPMNLTWSHGGEVFAVGISPEMGKHCDLGRIIKPEHRKLFGDDVEGVPDSQTLLALDLEFKPNTKSHIIRPGAY